MENTSTGMAHRSWVMTICGWGHFYEELSIARIFGVTGAPQRGVNSYLLIVKANPSPNIDSNTRVSVCLSPRNKHAHIF